jgi:hypothetical protein
MSCRVPRGHIVEQYIRPNTRLKRMISIKPMAANPAILMKLRREGINSRNKMA